MIVGQLIMVHFTLHINVRKALAIVVCCLLFLHCKQDEPLLIDVYPVRAVFYWNYSEHLFFYTTDKPHKILADYLDNTFVNSRRFDTDPYVFQNIPMDAANRFIQKDTSVQQYMNDTFELGCRIQIDYPEPGYGRLPLPRAYLEVVTIKTLSVNYHPKRLVILPT